VIKTLQKMAFLSDACHRYNGRQLIRFFCHDCVVTARLMAEYGQAARTRAFISLQVIETAINGLRKQKNDHYYRKNQTAGF
jgi:hypothetical protein